MLAKLSQFSELHDASSKRWTQLSSFTASLFLLLTQNCEGGVQVVGPSQPVKATVGEDVLLSCRLEPAADASDMSVEWSRENLDPRFVFVWWDREELESSKHPSYKGRTSLLVNKLELGEVSLKLSKVKPSDEGKYRCFIPSLGRESTVELVVGAVSVPVISLSGLDRSSSSVVLQCESAGWYPEPELLWLDGEGKLLSAGPPETVRGLDDLYTVSSRVTVEKRHSNTFTCRVQQNNINQSRETRIHVADDVFMVLSSSTSTTIGLAVSLVVSIVLFIVLFVRTRRQNRRLGTSVNEKQHQIERMAEECVDINNHFQQEKQNNEILTSRLEELQEEKNKWMKTKGKLHAGIQKMNQELEKKLQEENQEWTEMKNNLKTELQKMIQELELKGPITLEEVSRWGFCIRLKNISSEEIKLEGWMIILQINNREPDIFTFDESHRLQTGRILCLRHPDCSSEPSCDVDLEWEDLKFWTPADQLQITISNNEQIYRLL